MKSLQRKKQRIGTPPNYDEFFRIGVSPDYILVREDFPVGSVPPGEFRRLIRTMFHKNAEVLDATK